MRQRHKDQRSLPVLKFVGATLIASMSGACSSDILRFSDSPFGNPFTGRADTATTGSINAPMQKVKASALGMPKPASGLQAFPGASMGETGQVAAMTQVAAAGSSPVTGSVAGWTASGGTPVMLRSGDTIEALSGRYGVPTAALRQINGLSGNAQPSAGQQLIIPAYNPGSSAKKAASVMAAPAAQAPRSAPRYESLTETAKAKPEAVAAKPRYLPLPSEDDEEDDSKPGKIIKQAPKAAAKAPARVEPATTASVKAKMQAKAPAKVVDEDEDEVQPLPKKAPATGGFKPVEKAKPLAAAPAKAPAKVAAKTAPKVADDDDEDEAPVAPVKAAQAPKVAEPVKTAKVETPKAAPKAEQETTGSVASQEFRWPARGRVISGYGSKGPSGANDGINIALPEGTPVKAAEGGTVAYAGEEIRGYGKMVLIRHPNGYVSAYAHNGDLNVKRGDTVKRGQQIAKSGQSGNVTSPQLHFELRKGSEPVDPSKYLEGN